MFGEILWKHYVAYQKRTGIDIERLSEGEKATISTAMGVFLGMLHNNLETRRICGLKLAHGPKSKRLQESKKRLAQWFVEER